MNHAQHKQDSEKTWDFNTKKFSLEETCRLFNRLKSILNGKIRKNALDSIYYTNLLTTLCLKQSNKVCNIHYVGAKNC